MRIPVFFLVFMLCTFAELSAKVSIDSRSVKLVGQGEITEFSGDVRIKSDTYTLKSDKALSDKKSGIIKANGNVEIVTERYKLTSRRVVLNKNTNHLEAYEQVRIVSGSYNIDADKAELDEGKDSFTAEGNVIVSNEDMTLKANRALGDENKLFAYGDVVIEKDSYSVFSETAESDAELSAIEVSSNVVIRGNNFDIRSDRARALNSMENLEAWGNVIIEYSTGSWKLSGTCREARVSEPDKLCFLKKDVDALYIDTAPDGQISKTRILSEDVKLDYSSDQKAEFTGDVLVVRAQLYVISEKASYDHKTGYMLFSGYPVAYNMMNGQISEFKGEKIELSTKEELIELKGDAKAKVELKDDFKM